jgi:GNAT superfamily N-acetyltransferase
MAASMGGYLDDLFVASAARGQGVGTALIKAVLQIGQLQGWSVIRWGDC